MGVSKPKANRGLEMASISADYIKTEEMTWLYFTLARSKLRNTYHL